MLGHLVTKLGLSEAVAGAIVGALTQGGMNLVVAFWPMLAPFVWTLQGVLAVAGATAVIAY